MHSDLDPAKPKDLTESTARPKWFREFGVAIEPSVVKASAYAAMVGFIVGLVAQGLLELIYLFTKEPPQNNLDNSRLRLLVSWTDRVVPFAVKSMGLNIQRTHLIVRYFDFQRILALV